MVSMRGGSAPQGGTSSDQFYTASQSHYYPTYHAPVEGGAGQSKYVSPEAEAMARPYADVGKFKVNMFDPMPAGASDLVTPEQASGATPAVTPESQVPFHGVPVLGNITDFIAQLGTTPSFPAMYEYRHLMSTPDAQLDPIERQTKASLGRVFEQYPDSPMMQGKQISEMLNVHTRAVAHAAGSSAIVTSGEGDPGKGLGIGELITVGGGVGNRLVKRFLTSGGLVAALPDDIEKFVRTIPVLGGVLSLGSGDQLKELTKPGVTKEELGPERWAIKQEYESGEINEEEARDMIVMSTQWMSNPNPVNFPDQLIGPIPNPLDTVINMSLAFIGEAGSDPAVLSPLAAGRVAGLGARSVGTTLRSVITHVAEQEIEADALSLGRTVAEHRATAYGSQKFEEAALRVTRATEEHAAQSVASQAILRNLPKAATIAAKQTGAVPSGAIKNFDRLASLLEMGADTNHPWSSAIKQGVVNAGIHGDIAVKVPQIAKLGEAISRIIDPLTMFGYWRTGKTVPLIGSRLAAHGFLDGIGWRVARKLDSHYDDAGVDPELRQKARDIAASNHTVQAGNRANEQRIVTANSVFNSGKSNTEMAIQHAERSPGDIRRLVRDQVDRTLEFIVPGEIGGAKKSLAAWRDRAARYLVDFGSTQQDAARVAGGMGEREMRALFNDHWGLMIDVLDAAKRKARSNAKWTKEQIGRITFMGPRQMSKQDAAALTKAITDGDITAVREAVRRFADLNRHISESLSDQELLAKTTSVLGQIKGSLPTRIEDLTQLPASLRDFATDHPDYHLMLSPSENDLLVGVRDPVTNRITGVQSWVDHITDRTPTVEVSRLKAQREFLFRGVSGGEIERNVSRRFAFEMGEYNGLSEAESSSLLRSIRKAAEIAGVGKPTGLDSSVILAAVRDTPGLTAGRKVIAERQIIDSLLKAYESEMELVGVLPKTTGWIKRQVNAVPGGGALRWATDYLYQTVRFTKNSMFFVQEVPEAPFFLALQGRYPIYMAVPDIAVAGLERVPGLGRAGAALREAKAEVHAFDADTMVVMNRMARVSPNSDYDFYEAAELARMGLTQAGVLLDSRTALGRLVRKLGANTDLSSRKAQSVARAARAEFGEQWRRSLMENAPEQWLATRAFYPKHYTDGEVAISWVLDLMARGSPDSVYTVLSPELFRPSHIGARAEISDVLIRHFVYGEDDAQNHTWDSLVSDIKDGRVSIDQVRHDLEFRGADPDYVERAVHQLTFGTADEFYAGAVANGVPEDTVGFWRSVNKEAAVRSGLSEQEFLSRRYVGRPLSTDQMGNIVGDTMFDDVDEIMRVRGRPLPESGSPEVAGQMAQGRDMITEVFPPERAAVPRGSPPNVRRAAAKANEWEKAHTDRVDGTVSVSPPTRDLTPPPPRWKGEPVPGYTISYEEYAPGLYHIYVYDKNGSIAGSVGGSLRRDGYLHTDMIEVRPGHKRKGIGNWMYREWEGRSGWQIHGSEIQLDEGRALYSQPDRPFGPTTRTHRDIHTAYEEGYLHPVGGQVLRNPADLKMFSTHPWGAGPDYAGEMEHLPLRISRSSGFADDEPMLEYAAAGETPAEIGAREGGWIEPVPVDVHGRVLANDDVVQAAIELDRQIPVQVYDYPPEAPKGSVAMGVSRMRPEIGEAATYDEVLAMREHPTIAAAHEELPKELAAADIPIIGKTEVIGRFEDGAEPSLVIHINPNTSSLAQIDRAGRHAVLANEQDAVVTTIRGFNTIQRLGLKPNGVHFRLTGLPTDDTSIRTLFDDIGHKLPAATYDPKAGSLDVSLYTGPGQPDIQETLTAFRSLEARYKVDPRYAGTNQPLGAVFEIEHAHIRWFWQNAEVENAARESWFHGPEDASFVARTTQPVGGRDGGAVAGGAAGDAGRVQYSTGYPSQPDIPTGSVGRGGGYGGGLPAAGPSAGVGPLYQTPIHTIGPVTPEQYLHQFETMMDPAAMSALGMRAMTEHEALRAVEWYDHTRRAAFALVDENLSPKERIQEAARILVSFGTTQVNTSPADGWRHILRAVGMKARGETLPEGEARKIIQQAIGLNPEQLQNLIWGEGGKVDQFGIGQKLFDFIDSLVGSRVRTNRVRGPKGDWGPVAVDIWTKRDLGFLDPKMGKWVYRLVQHGEGENAIRGVSSEFVKGEGFVVKMSDGSTERIGMEHIGGGVPTNHEYDYAVEQVNAIRDHFNDVNFMNRRWESYEVQALGWYRMQMMKSVEGDGEVANALFDQSRWMGSQDLVPSTNAPIHEVHPWGDVAPQYHRAIHVEGARHASDEAEMYSGASVLSRMDGNAVVGGTYRPAQTVELLTDPDSARQYLAHYLLTSEQDSGVLMRDRRGVATAPNYAKGIGISVDIPVDSEIEADHLLNLMAAADDGPLRRIGSHTFVARAEDGSLHLRTLWEPTGRGTRRDFDKAVAESGVVPFLQRESPGTIARDTMVDFIALKHNWKKDPTGKSYMDVLMRGGGPMGVTRSPAERTALINRHTRAARKAEREVRRVLEGAVDINPPMQSGGIGQFNNWADATYWADDHGLVYSDRASDPNGLTTQQLDTIHTVTGARSLQVRPNRRQFPELDALMKPLPEGVVGNRALIFDELGDIDLNQVKVGDDVQLPGYLSVGTTADSGWGGQHRLEITIAPGTPVLYSDPFSVVGGDGELLIGYGQNLHITSIEQIAGQTPGSFNVKAQIGGSVLDHEALDAAERASSAARRELNRARGTPEGRPAADVQELVRSARVRVRHTVAGAFDRYASREVRNARERVLGEARDAAAERLGTDPEWGDVLDLARGSNGERLFERTPGGTVRAAITRSASDANRSQLYFNRAHVKPSSLLHEIVHDEASRFDDSANRTIAGVFSGLEGTPYGTWTPGTPLTEAQHEFLVSQYFLWAKDPDTVHPTMGPLLQHLSNKLGSERTLRSQALAPNREAIKTLDGEIAALVAHRNTLKRQRAIDAVNVKIGAKQVQRQAAVAEGRALRASGGLHPDVKRVLDAEAEKAGRRVEQRASTYNTDEQDMMEWAQIGMRAAQKRANDLVHMRGERSAFERSINHPFLALYPSSYMYGKVLPYLAEFLLFRPFGQKVPFAAYNTAQRMYQSFQRQQQYDPELRNYLYRNEPFLRTMSLITPGLPWDMPVGLPYIGRRIIENWMTNQVRREKGQKEEKIDPLGLAADSALYQLTLRGPDSWSAVAGSAPNAADIFGAILTGQTPAEKKAAADAALQAQQP